MDNLLGHLCLKDSRTHPQSLMRHCMRTREFIALGIKMDIRNRLAYKATREVS